MQSEINFNKPITHKENNSESQRFFETNERRFSNQCKIIMDAFLRGETLNYKSALIKYDIGDFRRRIKDLQDTYKVKGLIGDLTDKRFKEWHLNIGIYNA
jgi:hypothetical protein